MSATTRRIFLARSAAIAGVGLFGIPDKASATEELLGHGTHRYRVASGWGTFNPETHPANNCGNLVQHLLGAIPERQNPLGACIDKRDPANPMLVITSHETNELHRYDPDGKYIDAIPTPGGRCCSISIHDENLYVAHQNGFISILDESNRVISNPGGSKPAYFADGKLKRMTQEGNTFLHPHSILVDDEGNVYVHSANSSPIKLARVAG
ncbi:MAG: hypothetical protein L3K26_00380 [Candidatus Hydrogenedentes bacterium]|nr:hypothetical protein [Candidatus Hydrogenedentota bacterium]